MGLLGILLALVLLVWLAYRGWSVLLIAPLAALVAAGVAREHLQNLIFAVVLFPF